MQNCVDISGCVCEKTKDSRSEPGGGQKNSLRSLHYDIPSPVYRLPQLERDSLGKWGGFVCFEAQH